jgi:hypothetical protein
MAMFCFPVNAYHPLIILFNPDRGVRHDASYDCCLCNRHNSILGVLLTSFYGIYTSEMEEGGYGRSQHVASIQPNHCSSLSVPALATLAIFSFLTAWNELFFVVLMSRDSSTFTIPAGIANLSTQMLSQHSLIAAFIISVLPVLLVFIFAQQYVVKGMTAGALKV